MDGERLAFFWDFLYEWPGPEGASITWMADQSRNGIELSVAFSALTDTCWIGGEGTMPVNVATVMPEGSMTGTGSTIVDVGGSYGNGLVSLTILETTGGSYTIMVDEYAMSAATPQNINRYEMVFNWEAVMGGLGDKVTIGIGNGFVSGNLELLDAWNPER
ncbi:MAG: hypothetical protein MZW92_52900 [Comamonadaceae bacterium]|nr:hypothetical protein [Comamonadaceae bacterium]